jgi:hypothetical protein
VSTNYYFKISGVWGLYFLSQALDLLFGCIFLQGVLNPVFQLRRVGMTSYILELYTDLVFLVGILLVFFGIRALLGARAYP